MASAGGHWSRKGNFVTRRNYGARALGLAMDLNPRIRKLGDRIAASQPIKGYYNAKENKRRAAAVAAMEKEKSILVNRGIALRNAAYGMNVKR